MDVTEFVKIDYAKLAKLVRGIGCRNKDTKTTIKYGGVNYEVGFGDRSRAISKIYILEARNGFNARVQVEYTLKGKKSDQLILQGLLELIILNEDKDLKITRTKARTAAREMVSEHFKN